MKMTKETKTSPDARRECFKCYGGNTGVCKNTDSIFKDINCPYYVSIFERSEDHDKP